MKARIVVMPKSEVLDPQGKAVESALKRLGFGGVSEARVGKCIDVKLSAKNKSEAEKELRQMCEKLLANPVIENATYELTE